MNNKHIRNFKSNCSMYLSNLIVSVMVLSAEDCAKAIAFMQVIHRQRNMARLLNINLSTIQRVL